MSSKKLNIFNSVAMHPVEKLRLRGKLIAYITVTIVSFILLLFSPYLDRLVDPYRYIPLEKNYQIQEQCDVDDLFEVHFIDVGLADATFIKFPDGKTMLIDCGADLTMPSKSKNALTYYLDLEVFNHASNKVIDYLVVTHPNTDHFYSAITVLQNYEVKNIVRPIVLTTEEKTFYQDDGILNEMDNFEVIELELYKEFITFANDYVKNQSDRHMIFGTSNWKLIGENYFVQAVSPAIDANFEGNLNNYSICLQIECFKKKIMLMGDAEDDAEKEVLNYFASNIGAMNCDILKVAHHGSATSSSPVFLQAVNPQICVISTRYGVYSQIPANITLENIALNTNADVFRTDLNGNIVCVVNNDSAMNIYTSTSAVKMLEKTTGLKFYHLIVVFLILSFTIISGYEKKLTKKEYLALTTALRLQEHIVDKYIKDKEK